MLFTPREEGQALAEYALILLAVFVVVLMALGMAGQQVIRMYAELASKLLEL